MNNQRQLNSDTAFQTTSDQSVHKTVWHWHRRAAEIFPEGGQRQHFADASQVADDAVQTYVHETLYRFYTTTPQRKCDNSTTTVKKNALRGSHNQLYYDNFHNRSSADFQSRVILTTEVLPWSLTKPQIMTLFYLARLISRASFVAVKK